ncbi:hypothetical protein HPP92_009763 [Vanilla planifolia]|uniref:HECT-type E3 ubiquitin transferase n=1 Tax=Vanilla planifolia TaxID=51239 RepID=A0A835RJY7_VANPL|nr:hypothetical protein HPP92_009974 [Vanilla planifolia]KAG0487668.1 hypothetical protein HPP92_009763 [Vanilla planifolia]
MVTKNLMADQPSESTLIRRRFTSHVGRSEISQVSLRGASAREISRNALLEKVVHERQLRNFTRRASAAAIFIQRVWRRFYVMKKVGKQLQEQWTALADSFDNQETVDWISSNLIRPFLFFTSSFTSHLNLNLATEGCLSPVCFKFSCKA